METEKLEVSYKFLREDKEKFEKLMNRNGIEFRRGNAGGGNQMRQPYIKNYLKNNSPIIQVEILSKKLNFHFQENQIYEYLNGLNYQLVGRKKHYTTHLFSDVICVDYLFEKIL